MLKLCLMLDQANMTKKSSFTGYKTECASVIASLNACNGYFVWSPTWIKYRLALICKKSGKPREIQSLSMNHMKK